MNFSLIVPCWNEEKNIEPLVSQIENIKLNKLGMSELILIDNGSNDNTKEIIRRTALRFSWIKPLYLKFNLQYGGGVFEGLRKASNSICAVIPADLQIEPKEVVKLWLFFKQQYGKNNNLLCKGFRNCRYDNYSTRLVSFVYNLLANLILKLKIKDVNGLPKIFDRRLLDYDPSFFAKNFIFDCQLIYTARQNKWAIYELPVEFKKRHIGTSSWSKRKLMTYLQVFFSLLKIKFLGRA